MESKQTEQVIWWKDKKLLAGVILVVLSFILGFYSKVLVIVKVYEPVAVITGLSIYAFSWILLFIGVFLVGWETVKMIQMRIQHQVRKTARETYDYTKELPRKGYHYTKQLHRKSIARIKKSIK